uniref:Uncharacterized protein n=1 Tax=Geobacillus sp. (strain WCH70) TaxID=471223 RepID=C5D301_GEOSW
MYLDVAYYPNIDRRNAKKVLLGYMKELRFMKPNLFHQHQV